MITSVRIPNLFGGVSEQPPHLRYPGQVDLAQSVGFDLASGAYARFGSRLDAEIGSPTGMDRIYAIDRDGAERYIIAYGTSGGTTYIRAWDAANGYEECTVNISADAQSYLDHSSPSSDQLRFSTIADYTFIVNQATTILLVDTDEYDAAFSVRDFDALLSLNPTIGDKIQTREDTATELKGFYEFAPAGTATWSTFTFDAPNDVAWARASFGYDNSTSNPMGFNIGFGHWKTPVTAGEWDTSEKTLTSWTQDTALTVDAATYTQSTRTLTQVGKFAGYTFEAGDYINITGGTPAAPDYSASTIDISGYSCGGTSLDGTYDHQGSRNSKPYWRRFLGVTTYAYIYWTGSKWSIGTSSTWPTVSNEFYYLSDDTPYPDAGAWIEGADGCSPVISTSNNDMPTDLGTGRYEIASKTNDDTIVLAGVGLGATWDGVSDVTADSIDHGTFRDYTHASLDSIRITGGTNTAAAWHVVSSKDEDWQITLDTEITSPAGDQTDITASYIGRYYEDVTLDFENSGITEMEDIALEMQAELRSRGERDALVAWMSTTDKRGYFAITAGVRGEDGHVFEPESPTDTNLLDLTTSPRPLVSGTHTQGTGSPSAKYLTPVDRWTRISGPGQAAGKAQPTRMPVQMVRTSAKDGVTPAVFDIDIVNWSERTSGNQNSNPGPALFTESSRITDIALHRGRLVLAGDEYVAMSKADDLFNFWVSDPENIADDDPIDVQLSSTSITIIDRIVPFRNTLVIFTKAGRQFELNAPEALTPATAAITPTTNYFSGDAQPVLMGSRLYFTAERDQSTILYEYKFDDLQVSLVAQDVSQHAAEYLPSDIKAMAAAPNENTVALATGVDNDVYLWTTAINGSQRIQSAWSKWQFPSSYDIYDIAVIGSRLYMLIDSSSEGGRMIQSIPLHRIRVDPDGAPFPVRLDARQMIAAGDYDSYDSGNDRTTFTVLSNSDWAVNLSTGVDIDVFSSAGTTLILEGDHRANDILVGKRINSRLVLNKVMAANESGIIDLNDRQTLQNITVAFVDTGYFEIRAIDERLLQNQAEYDAGSGTVTEFGIFSYGAGGNALKTTVELRNQSVRPSVWTAVEFRVLRINQ